MVVFKPLSGTLILLHAWLGGYNPLRNLFFIYYMNLEIGIAIAMAIMP